MRDLRDAVQFADLELLDIARAVVRCRAALAKSSPTTLDVAHAINRFDMIRLELSEWAEDFDGTRPQQLSEDADQRERDAHEQQASGTAEAEEIPPVTPPKNQPAAEPERILVTLVALPSPIPVEVRLRRFLKLRMIAPTICGVYGSRTRHAPTPAAAAACAAARGGEAAQAPPLGQDEAGAKPGALPGTSRHRAKKPRS